MKYLSLLILLSIAPLSGSDLIPAINEFMASNDDALVLPDGSSPDWIEIHNPGTTPLALAGWHLTDDPQLPTRWTFPAGVTLAPGSFLLVYATGLNLNDPTGDLHTNFQLTQSGEYLALVNPAGGIHQEFAPTYPEQFEDLSYGLPLGETTPAYFTNATPGATNNEPTLGIVEDTKFSADRGFYDTAFDVTISSASPGATIYYTTDGSPPTAQSSSSAAVDGFTPPTATVTISDTTILRAFAAKDNFLPTDIDTQSYFFLNEVIARPEMSNTINGDPVWGPQMRGALLAIPSFSIITQEEIPIDEPNIPNPREIPISIEMIYPDGREGFQANAGAERFGGQYTLFDGLKKNLRISFKEIYGPKRLRFNLFDDVKYGAEDAVDNFNQFLLRNGSHDALFFDRSSLLDDLAGGFSYPRPRNGAYVRNRYFLDRQFEMGHNSLRGKFVHVYLNGVYYGHYHLMERPTDDHMAEYYGGNESDYDIVRGRSGIEYQSGTGDAWQTLVANSSNWSVVQQYLDVDNYIDYMLLNFYGGNDHDWYPNHNWVAGRKRDETGRFRFFMWDSDFLMRARLPDGGNTVDNGGPSNILNRLKTIPEFRERMADRAQKHFYGNGALSRDKVNADFNTFGSELARTIIPETARWGYKNSDYYTPDTFQDAISWLANDYPNGNLRPRVETVIQQMRDANLFPDIDAPIFSPYGGEIPSGSPVAINHTEGNLYYTTDGTDPRMADGSINPNAIAVGGSLFPATVIAKGSSWKFDDSKVQPAANWYSSDYNDSAWQEGNSPMAPGFGSAALDAAPATATTVFEGTSNGMTFYARKTFNVTGASSFLGSSINIAYDDGFIVYLNGQEIIRKNLPGGTVSIDTAATGNGTEDDYVNFPFDLSLLSEGENVIAIEVHNRSLGNVDLGFDLELVGESRNPNRFVTLNETSTIKTRVLSDNPTSPEWSALSEATFITDTPAAAGNLVISEIHYHPSLSQGNDAEYIELMNISDQRISLAGVRFTEGITYTFGDQASLAAGERLILIYNQAAFESAYGTEVPVAGTFLSRLSNGGERLTLAAADESIIESFVFGDASPWPTIADGVGYSLVRVSPTGNSDPLGPQNWRSSLNPGGTPAGSDSTPYLPDNGQTLLQYATGGNNTGSIEFLGNAAIFEYRRSHGADDVTIEVQVSSDLENWSTAGTTFLDQTNTPGDTARMRWILPTPEGVPVFARIHLVLNQ